MTIVDAGLDAISNAMGAAGSIPVAIAIGTGSTTVTVAQTALNTETDRNSLTGDGDASTEAQVTYIADFGTEEMSGTTLAEFGLFSSTAPASPDMFQREAIAGKVFDGSNELQIQMTHKYQRP